MTEIEKLEAVKNLKEALNDIPIPQAKVAKSLDITPSYLNRIFAGVHVPGEDLAIEMGKIADKLNSSGLKAI